MADRGTDSSPLLGALKWVTNPYAFGAFCVAAVALFALNKPWIAGAILLMGIVGLVVGLRRTPPEALGRLAAGGDYRHVAKNPAAPPSSVLPAELSPLERIMFLHLLVGGTFGKREQFQVRHFLDLMSAILVPDHADILVETLATHIRTALPGEIRRVGVVLGPKRGNAVLIERVARELGLRCLLIKQRALFGQWLEGVVPENKLALLVDDISSDGELLKECVARARMENLVVSTAVVLVDRVEGDAATKLAEQKVQLVPFLRLSDEDLAQLASRGRAS